MDTPNEIPEKPFLHWIRTEGDYELALAGGRLLCRDIHGDILPQVPRRVMRSKIARRMLSVGGILIDHKKACADTVERWMLRSLPTSGAVLESVWPDPTWKFLLEHLVVLAIDVSGFWNPAHQGVLMGVPSPREVDLLTPSGQRIRVEAQQVFIPHPSVLDHLASYRRLLHEEGIEQGALQVYREVHRKPVLMDPSSQSLNSFCGKIRASPKRLALRARSKGYRVQGGHVTCALQEWGRQVSARIWIGEPGARRKDPGVGELQWVDARGRVMSMGSVGPVSFSEGHRMGWALCEDHDVRSQEKRPRQNAG